MKRSLLDVNVLLALMDSDHHDHRLAREWFKEEVVAGWASCNITQNGFVRVISQPRYTNSVAPSRAIDMLAAACRHESHQFLPSDLSITDPAVERSRVLGSRQVTDVYLLALAVSSGCRLVTLDRSIPVQAVPAAGPDHLFLLA